MRLVGKFCSKPVYAAHTVTDAVKDHLTVLLNATAGFSHFDFDYGIPCEIGERPSPQLMQSLCEHIRIQINRWESRFSLTDVRYELDARESSILLCGEIDGAPCQFRVQLRGPTI
ncbi:GPW/gp25 family protein [Vibrio spartinae]|uniref:Gene 25-like lysozyme n=1 Tax=Vibrio spartinae TaxID=1918945 RepID=A0A1N6M3L6_9VIBR|nr:GPW/gp25 family protein [Vibrio spartinae]QMV14490.1 type VI secretion system lysozyme-like protein [Vibrio spartinae]SIO93980.1 Gene 25-like lysozyme [Vibrio spartinae]